MENKLKFLLFVTLITIIQGCDYMEFRGFVTSYETVDERYDQSMTWNETHSFRTILINQNDYNIYVMGDSHLGTTDNLNRFFYAAKQDKSVATVMVGDLSTGNKSDYETLENNIPNPDSLLTFQIVGNHDLYFDGWKQFYARFGSSTYYFVVQTPGAKDLYICLDSGGGTLGGKQLTWFQNLLKDHRNEFRHCVVFSHVNIFRIRNTLSTNPYPDEVLTLSQLCIEHNVSMVLNGHDHIKNVVHFGPTTYITMDALQDGLDYAGYTILKNSGDSLSYQNINFF